MDEIKVLLADKAEVFREGLARLLEGNSGIQVVSTCSSGLECVEKAMVFKPNVILLGSDISNYDCIETTRLLNQSLPEARLIILINSEEGDQLSSILKAKASAYVGKGHPVADLVRIILDVNKGMKLISSPAAGKLLEVFAAAESSSERTKLKDERLSEREQEVLSLVAKGATNRQIADALSISENTVKAHMCRIFEKLHAQNRQEAAARFLRKNSFRRT